MEGEESAEEGRRSLREALAAVPDPRSRHGRRYPLEAILALAVCAMLSGARSRDNSSSPQSTDFRWFTGFISGTCDIAYCI